MGFHHPEREKVLKLIVVKQPQSGNMQLKMSTDKAQLKNLNMPIECIQ
jgi:hypothetical protein